LIPVNLLAILAASFVAIVYGTYLPVHELLVVVFAGAAVAVMIRAAPPDAPSYTDVIDERENERVMTIAAYAGAVAIGAIALLIAFVSPSVALALLAITALWVVVWWPRWLRTDTIDSSIVVERDPATVFGFVSNMENEPRFYPELQWVKKVTPGPIGAGTEFRARMAVSPGHGLGLGPWIFEGVEQIIEYEPNRRLTSRVNGLHANFGVVTFEPVPNGTRVIHHFEFVSSYSDAVGGSILLFGPSSKRDRITRRTAAWARAKEIMESDGQ
jgi:hypothetical protein